MAERLAASRLPRRLAVKAQAEIPDQPAGVLGARIFAYFVDSLVLSIFAIAFLGIATLNLLLQTHGGFTDVSDSALWQFVYISLAAIPAWILMTFVLLTRRGQTPGHYVTGLAVVRPDGSIPSPPQVLLRLLALDPLAFHPVLGLLWALAALVSLSKDTSGLVFVLGAAMAIMCLVAPFVALFASSADGGRRGLHDRVAGLMVVRLE